MFARHGGAANAMPDPLQTGGVGRGVDLGWFAKGAVILPLYRSVGRDLEAATANLAMHPVTGAFADPALESAFAAQLFRMAYPFHAFLMTLPLAAYAWIALTALPDLRGLFVTVALLIALGLLGRALLHRMADSVGAQRMGSWTWTATLVLGCVVDIAGCIFAPDVAWATVEGLYRGGLHPLMILAVALTNGSLGMGFAHKFALALPVPVFSVIKLTVCDDERTLADVLCEIGTLGAGSIAAHMLELYLRSSYVERVEEKRRLEVRMEQLKAEKERLLYDVQRRDRPHDDDNRSAIRRGLQGTHPREAGDPTPSDSPLPSLPPGAPSSTADSSSIALPPDAEGAGTQSSCVETGASPPMSEAGYMEVEEAMKDLMGDEEVVLELQGISSVQTNPENVADVAVVQPRVIAHRVQEAVDSTPQGQGAKRERQEPHLPVGVLVGLSVGPPVNPSCGQLPESLDDGQGSRTPRQQALHVARQSLQIAHTEVEIFQVVRDLSLALGSVRTESGTVKAVHAVLLQLDRPGMAEREAAALTGASLSNFKKWRRRVQHAQLDLPPPPTR